MSTYTKVDCANINRIKLIKIILRTDPNMNLRGAKLALDNFIAEVQAEAREGETLSQRMSRRDDALEIYKCMLERGISYEIALNSTKNALRAFNEEF